MYTDFHSHILPKADHGSTGIEQSLVQIKAAATAGIDRIFATPHFYLNNDSVERFVARRERTYNRLAGELSAQSIDMQIIKSAEVNLQLGLDELPELRQLCIEGTDYMLLEMPMSLWTEWVYRAIEAIQARGIKLIIAHIDRYRNNKLDRLLEYDVLTQINADAVTSLFSRRRMLKLISQRSVNFLGSDSHNDEKQYRAFAKAAGIIGEDDMQLFRSNAEYILK